MRRELERVAIPREHEARERAWAVVRAAYDEREPQARERRSLRPLAVLAALAAVAAAAASPPGRAVVQSVREAVGVADADQALFALPAPGRLLATSDAGAWIVHADGSKRLLGSYDDVSWSPFGRYVVGVRAGELVALEPDGDVRWKLARPQTRLPRWGGSRTDTRIAYLTRDELRVVGGDGRGDSILARGVAPVAPAWRPAARHVVAYAEPGRIVVADAETGRRLWTRRAAGVMRLEWSGDGRFLLVQGHRLLRVHGAGGALRHDLLGRDAAPVVDATISAEGAVAFVQRVAGRSHLWTVPRLAPDASAARRLFAGPGSLSGIAWSPDGRWIAVGWSEADQWLFVPAAEGARVRAAADVAGGFDSRSPPRLRGWCCR